MAKTTGKQNGNGKGTVEKKVSRRAKIIELAQQNKWTTDKLAEQLHKVNSEWIVLKNKAAITKISASHLGKIANKIVSKPIVM